jgi:anaerobic selenocysteine-containing dehydrogenase
MADRYESPAYKIPECIVIWGYNIPATCPDNVFGHWIIDLMKRGAKIIAIDPRLSWFASRAEKWLRLRPGTDGALAMGFLNVIINEGLYDESFVEKWTNGHHLVRRDTGKLLRESDLVHGGSQSNFVVWDAKNEMPAIWDSNRAVYQSPDVKPALTGDFEVGLGEGSRVQVRSVWDMFCEEVNKYPLERVAEITLVNEKDIRDAAILYAKSKPASIHWGVPIDMTPAVTPTSQAIACL